MRIGIITGEYPPLEGGVGDFTRQLALALHALGHELHVLTTAGERPGKNFDPPLTVHREIEDWGWGSHTRLTRWIREVAPDVVNVQYQAAAYQMKGGITLYPRWQRRHISVPLVVTYHDLLPPYLFPKAGPLRHWSVRQLAQYADGVIVTNGGDYTALTESLEDAAPPIRLIPIGSNIAPNPPDGYERAAWRAAQGFAPDDKLIGFFGFMNRSKGIETLLDALKHLRDREQPVHLLFIGGRTGSSDFTNRRYADEIDARIRELGLDGRVHRTGFSMPAEVSAALLGVDVCALPYRDGASLRRGTLHAALTHGCATVTTTPAVETPHLRDGENALLVPPEDPAALAAAIGRLLNDATLRQKLGAAAEALAQEFSWDRIAAHTAEFFRSLLA